MGVVISSISAPPKKELTEARKLSAFFRSFRGMLTVLAVLTALGFAFVYVECPHCCRVFSISDWILLLTFVAIVYYSYFTYLAVHPPFLPSASITASIVSAHDSVNVLLEVRNTWAHALDVYITVELENEPFIFLPFDGTTRLTLAPNEVISQVMAEKELWRSIRVENQDSFRRLYEKAGVNITAYVTMSKAGEAMENPPFTFRRWNYNPYQVSLQIIG